MLSKAILKKLGKYLEKHKGPWLTDKIEENAKSAPLLKGYIFSKEPSEEEKLNAFLKKKKPFFHKLKELSEESEKKNGKKRKFTEICKAAHVSKQTFHKIFNKDFIPSKDTVLCFAFEFKASFEQAKTLLGYAGYAFGDCIYRDLFLRFCFEQNITDFERVNELLKLHKQKPLFKVANNIEKHKEKQEKLPDTNSLKGKSKKILEDMAKIYFGKSKNLVVLH